MSSRFIPCFLNSGSSGSPIFGGSGYYNYFTHLPTRRSLASPAFSPFVCFPPAHNCVFWHLYCMRAARRTAEFDKVWSDKGNNKGEGRGFSRSGEYRGKGTVGGISKA